MQDDTKGQGDGGGAGAGAQDGSSAASQAQGEGAAPAAKKKEGVATGVQASPKNPAEGVEVFPGVSAEAFNARQAKRRETTSDTF